MPSQKKPSSGFSNVDDAKELLSRLTLKIREERDALISEQDTIETKIQELGEILNKLAHIDL